MPKTSADPYLQIVNFSTLQHYKNRNPPWIKLYVELWDNRDFESLSDETKAHFLGLCVLASKHDNRIPYDKEWIARKLGANKTIDFDVLFASGLLARSKRSALAGCKQDAMPETEKRQRREEGETETEPTAEKRVGKRDEQYECFVESFENKTGVKYDRKRTQDFAQLAKLRQTQGKEVPSWGIAVTNYFSSDISTHTLSHLCAIYEPLTKGPLDRFGKHYGGNGNGQQRQFESKEQSRERRALEGLADVLEGGTDKTRADFGIGSIARQDRSLPTSAPRLVGKSDPKGV